MSSDLNRLVKVILITMIWLMSGVTGLGQGGGDETRMAESIPVMTLKEIATISERVLKGGYTTEEELDLMGQLIDRKGDYLNRSPLQYADVMAANRALIRGP